MAVLKSHFYAEILRSHSGSESNRLKLRDGDLERQI